MNGASETMRQISVPPSKLIISGFCYSHRKQMKKIRSLEGEEEKRGMAEQKIEKGAEGERE